MSNTTPPSETADESQHVKIEFRVQNETGGFDVETMWAVPLGDDRYRLDNTPFYAYGVSWDDIIIAKAQKDGFPVFESCAEKSGNSTVRIIFTEEEVQGLSAETMLAQLAEMGCSYEGADASYYAVNVPADTDLSEIAELLTHNEIMWEHADPSGEELSSEA